MPPHKMHRKPWVTQFETCYPQFIKLGVVAHIWFKMYWKNPKAYNANKLRLVVWVQRILGEFGIYLRPLDLNLFWEPRQTLLFCAVCILSRISFGNSFHFLFFYCLLKTALNGTEGAKVLSTAWWMANWGPGGAACAGVLCHGKGAKVASCQNWLAARDCR